MTSPELFYMSTGAGLVALALWRLATSADAIRRILGLNVLAVGIAMLFLAAARQAGNTDAVPQAFVLTGIVVLVAVTAALLALAERIGAFGDD
ncbi:NADH-quinone oxidoreductase subunit K [Mameliella sediminis]|uniref:NADH-quinone oxidoreductase subunit K n=1 Tax=Mameliella sediminis TaxID=2836866 RepID=UPI001C465F96|nr:NADH-quinone oxidoreductase subunit K [Mameliella sediminis]MBY6114822.1 NADH-quinone oxidoreductase subunit K [Antarctobacter heliothermus]MBY6144395.1 NADH-quinone oxidoreductase subunit K [Mameliella alba]MBV7392697.1 NADH-quinone oxidoreductase subunit K [Mameliella sediminis]MBY6163457.1 NADH-quinone oxidoreductase subunit K [Mameliella alba]MBY6171720.1 NADH-quinone oxidoreductase subunit K [Mameliella alba]